MKNIETEVRVIITDAEFRRLKKFFDKNWRFLDHYSDETWYFDKEGKIRLQLKKDSAYLIYKSGKMHDRRREELEIRLKKSDFILAIKFLNTLGKSPVVKWKRERFIWQRQKIKAYLDRTKNYGIIFELDAMTASKESAKIYKKMFKIFSELKIKPTPKKEIQKKYLNYIKSWNKKK